MVIISPFAVICLLLLHILYSGLHAYLGSPSLCSCLSILFALRTEVAFNYQFADLLK